MQDVDKQTSKALLDFSYHLAIGDMNEAYKVSTPQLLPCKQFLHHWLQCRQQYMHIAFIKHSAFEARQVRLHGLLSTCHR